MKRYIRSATSVPLNAKVEVINTERFGREFFSEEEFVCDSVDELFLNISNNIYSKGAPAFLKPTLEDLVEMYGPGKDGILNMIRSKTEGPDVIVYLEVNGDVWHEYEERYDYVER